MSAINDGLWMQPDEVRRQVREALDHEAATHSLERALNNAWRQCLYGADPDTIERRAKETQVFLTAYISATPGILEAVLAASKVAGIAELVEGLLRFADTYFRQAVDFIPDHLGLMGLIDDSYLSQRLMQGLCDDHQKKSGQRVLSVDLTHANTMVRVLIGEPTATGLDDAISNALKRREVADIYERFAKIREKLPVLIQAAYPSFDMLDGDQTIRLGALGGVN